MEYTVVDVKQLGEGNEYGTPYNVDFAEEKGVFMLAKRAPEVGSKEFGNITDAPKKSGQGTYRRFKREQQQGQASFSGSKSVKTEDPAKQDSIMKMNALNNAVALNCAVVSTKGTVTFEKVIKEADNFYAWLKGDSEEKVSYPELPKEEPKKSTFDDEINLDDIPF